ncbi:MAG: ATP-binding cassette domain-containing protein [Candidatus Marsarchaeota archaeon]|nr:ATP-binding cassette domain-containing protein [Candidatus Marsarchaeota archaeon]
MLLNAENLDVRYGPAQVLHGVSLHLNEGELVCVVGRNGAGKTTLLRTIGGFMRPERGTVTFRGTRVDGLPLEDVSLMGIKYVYQDKRVFGELTVRENIELAAYPTGQSPDEAIAKVLAIHPKMGTLLNSKAKGLSGGERQILLLGRALIGNPQLLLVDEPTEGLAAIIIGEIVDILLKMKNRITMMVVEQNLSTVARLADRLYVMKEGCISCEINDGQVIKNPSCYEEEL